MLELAASLKVSRLDISKTKASLVSLSLFAGQLNLRRDVLPKRLLVKPYRLQRRSVNTHFPMKVVLPKDEGNIRKGVHQLFKLLNGIW